MNSIVANEFIFVNLSIFLLIFYVLLINYCQMIFCVKLELLLSKVEYLKLEKEMLMHSESIEFIRELIAKI